MDSSTRELAPSGSDTRATSVQPAMHRTTDATDASLSRSSLSAVSIPCRSSTPCGGDTAAAALARSEASISSTLDELQRRTHDAAAATQLYSVDDDEVLRFSNHVDAVGALPRRGPAHPVADSYTRVDASTLYRDDDTVHTYRNMPNVAGAVAPLMRMRSSFGACQACGESCDGRRSRCHALDDLQQQQQQQDDMRPSEVKSWGNVRMLDGHHDEAHARHTGTDAFFHYFETMRPVCVRLGVLPLPHTLITQRETKEDGDTEEEEEATDGLAQPRSPSAVYPEPSLHRRLRRKLMSCLAQLPFVERFVHPRRFFQLLDTHRTDAAMSSDFMTADAGTYRAQSYSRSSFSENNSNHGDFLRENRESASSMSEILGWAGVFSNVSLQIPMPSGAPDDRDATEKTVQVVGTASVSIVLYP